MKNTVSRIKLKDAKEGDMVSGKIKKCRKCLELFVGRSNAVYCSYSCKNTHRDWAKIKQATPKTRKESVPTPIKPTESVVDISSLEEAPMWFINKYPGTYKLLDKYQGWVEKATTQEELDVVVEKFNKKAKKLLRLLKKEV